MPTGKRKRRSKRSTKDTSSFKKPTTPNRSSKAHFVKQIHNAFYQCQRSAALHSKCLRQIVQAWEKLQTTTFNREFFICLKYMLASPSNTKTLFIINVIKFTGAVVSAISLAAQENQNTSKESFASDALQFAIDLTTCKESSVRQRCCQLIAVIAKNLPDSIALDDDLWDKFQLSMLARTKDRMVSVRVKAVEALYRLQDPLDIEDPVLCEYIRILDQDPSKDVRKAVLEHIGVAPTTLDALLKRTSDVSEEVRCLAFKVFRKVPFHVLSVAQRMSLLATGLHDRDQAVKNSCLNMICDATQSWLVTCNNDISELVSNFDLEDEELLAELIVAILSFEATVIPTIDFSDIKLEEISKHRMFYWRCYCEFLWKQQKVENIELLPEIEPIKNLLNCVYSDFVTEIKQIRRKDKAFVMKQLLIIVKTLDYANELGRRQMSSILRHILPQRPLTTKLREIVIEAILVLHPDEHERTQILLEILADIVDPMNGEEENVLDKDANIAGLIVTKNLLLNISNKDVHPGIWDLSNTIIVPSVQSAHGKIRELGVECLGCLCLLDLPTALDYLLLFAQVAKFDTEPSAKLAALKVLFDMLCLYGYSTLEEQESQWSDLYKRNQEYEEEDELFSTSYSSYIVRLLVKFLRSPDISLRVAAVEGFSKLLLHGVLKDTKVLCTLILLFFHPSSGEEVRQCLNVFFCAFCTPSRIYPNAVKQNYILIAKAFIPTITLLQSAEENAPLHTIETSQVTKFILSLLVAPDGRPLPVQTALAIDITEKILTFDMATKTVFCKILSQLSASPWADATALDHFQARLYRLLGATADKTCLRYLKKASVNFFDTEDLQPAQRQQEIDKELPPVLVNNSLRKAKLEPKAKRRKLNTTSPNINGKKKRVMRSSIKKKHTRAPKRSKQEIIKEEQEQLNDAQTKIVEQAKDYWGQVDDFELETSCSPPDALSPLSTSRKRKRNGTKQKSSPLKQQVTVVVPDSSSSTSTSKAKEKDETSTNSIGAKRKSPASKNKDSPTKRQKNTTDTFTSPIKDTSAIAAKSPSIKATSSSSSKNNEVLSPKKKVLLSFTGFSPEQEEELCSKAEQLGLACLKGQLFSSQITHLVALESVYTAKVLIAAASKKWLMPPAWIYDSFALGELLPEKRYGSRNLTPAFTNKKVFISDSFWKDSPLKQNVVKLLVQKLGKGSIISQKSKADIILNGMNESKPRKKSVIALNYVELVSFVCPKLTKVKNPSR